MYDLDAKGCKSCFACKTKDGESYGSCAVKDDLTPVLKKVEEADAIILDVPIYLKVLADRFDPEKKAKRRKEVFPEDCEKAFEIGVRLAGKNKYICMPLGFAE